METKKAAAKNKNSKNQFFSYKNRPLVRCGEVLYYGNMSDGIVAKLKVRDTTKVKDIYVSGTVSIQLLDTDPAATGNEQILRASKKEGLYQALDVSSAWLDKYTSLQENV